MQEAKLEMSGLNDTSELKRQINSDGDDSEECLAGEVHLGDISNVKL